MYKASLKNIEHENYFIYKGYVFGEEEESKKEFCRHRRGRVRQLQRNGFHQLLLIYHLYYEN